jgi:cytochrome c-type biogenesis protein CcmH
VLSGPTAEDMQAAAEMTAEDRAAMIRNMVAQLSDRLATEGGTPEEWGRLIAAYGVLGDTDQARTIWAEAQQVFAGNDAALAAVDAGARRAGLTP